MKNKKRLWGYDASGEPWLINSELSLSKLSQMKRPVFAKSVFLDNGRLRTILCNPPFSSLDEMPDNALVDSADVAHWRGTTVATICSHANRGLLKRWLPKHYQLKGNLFRVREVKRWAREVSIGRWLGRDAGLNR